MVEYSRVQWFYGSIRFQYGSTVLLRFYDSTVEQITKYVKKLKNITVNK